MAELNEAFNCFNSNNKNYQVIDYFFTQRNMKENHEYLDKNMNRKSKKVSIIYNFLAISIPTYNENKDFIFEIEIFGDSGYHYKGTMRSYNHIVPNILVPLKGDKKIFIHVNHKDLDTEKSIKHYTCFIDVPKRFQSIDDNLINLKPNNSEIDVDNDDDDDMDSNNIDV